MTDREPKRTWTQAQIGTVERANPLARLAGGKDGSPARLIEAAVIFKHQTVIDSADPRTRDEQESKARKALWRYVHEGLDDSLFEILYNIRRASACVSSVDPAQTFLSEAAARLQVLIDHVLGNEQPIGKDGWADVALTESLKSRTQEQPNGLHGIGPDPRIPD
jgi:hypothetical protein